MNTVHRSSDHICFALDCAHSDDWTSIHQNVFFFNDISKRLLTESLVTEYFLKDDTFCAVYDYYEHLCGDVKELFIT